MPAVSSATSTVALGEASVSIDDNDFLRADGKTSSKDTLTYV